MEIRIWPAVILVGAGLPWAVRTEVVYRPACVARRGWEDERLELRDRGIEDVAAEVGF